MSDANRIDRRKLLIAGAAGLGAACVAKQPAARPEAQPVRSAADTGRVLVLIEMFGGNDGLSMFVPHQDDAYHRARPTLRFEANETLRLTDERGLHPAMPHLHRLYGEGQVAVVEGVGFADPIYSHFRTQEIWHTARREGRASGPGWIARLREDVWGDDRDRMLVVHVGGDMPYSLWSERQPAVSFRVASELEWLGDPAQRAAISRLTDECCDELRASRRDEMIDTLRRRMRETEQTVASLQGVVSGYRSSAEYPPEPFAASLRAIAAMLNSNARTRVYSVSLSNFDTHGAVQRGKQARLLAQLDKALGAFFADIAGTVAAERVLVLAYSEFGRRVAENISHGTDHGAAGPLLMLGSSVRGGLHGIHPKVSAPDADGNLVHTVDFRRAYATTLERWLGAPSAGVLGARFEPLDVLAT